MAQLNHSAETDRYLELYCNFCEKLFWNISAITAHLKEVHKVEDKDFKGGLGFRMQEEGDFYPYEGRDGMILYKWKKTTNG